MLVLWKWPRINAEAAMNREIYQQSQQNNRTAADNTTKENIAKQDNETKLATAKIGGPDKGAATNTFGEFYGALPIVTSPQANG